MTESTGPLDFSKELLRCPLTGSDLQLLDNAEEILAINVALKSGDLILSAGSIDGGVIDAILISSTGQHKYPVIGGVPCLLDDFRIVKLANTDASKKIDLQMSSLQREQWKAFSASYKRWNEGPEGVITKVQEEFQRRNASLLSEIMGGAVILDIGNGGQL